MAWARHRQDKQRLRPKGSLAFAPVLDTFDCALHFVVFLSACRAGQVGESVSGSKQSAEKLRRLLVKSSDCKSECAHLPAGLEPVPCEAQAWVGSAQGLLVEPWLGSASQRQKQPKRCPRRRAEAVRKPLLEASPPKVS